MAVSSRGANLLESVGLSRGQTLLEGRKVAPTVIHLVIDNPLRLLALQFLARELL